MLLKCFTLRETSLHSCCLSLRPVQNYFPQFSNDGHMLYYFKEIIYNTLKPQQLTIDVNIAQRDALADINLYIYIINLGSCLP